MCLASNPPPGGQDGSAGRQTLLGGEIGFGGSFDSNPDGFSGPDFGKPPGRRATLLTPPPETTSPAFGELDIAPRPSARIKPPAPDVSTPRIVELDIAPGGPPPTVPAFAPPGAFDAAPAPRLPKPALARHSILTRPVQGADLSGPLSLRMAQRAPAPPPAPAAPPVLPRPAARPTVAATKLDPPPRIPADPSPRPDQVKTALAFDPALSELLLTGGAASPVEEFKNVSRALSGLLPGTPSFERAQQRLTDLEKGFSEAERQDVLTFLLDRASSEVGDLADPFDGRATGDLRPPSFRSDFVENNPLGLPVKSVGDTIAGLKALAGRHPVNPFSGRILSPGEALDSQVQTLTGAATGLAGNAIGRMKRAFEARLKSLETRNQSATKLRSEKLDRATIDLLDSRIEPGKPRSLVRDAVTELLDGAVDTTRDPRKSVRNYEKPGDIFEAKVDFYAAIHNAKGQLKKVTPFQDGKGEFIDLPDGTRMQ